LFIATRKDRQQRAALRDAPAPRGRMPNSLAARQRMDRNLRTKRGRALYRQRGAAIEPVFGQMKDRQGAGRFSMRGLERCRGEWHLDAAVHNLRKLHRALSAAQKTPATARPRSETQPERGTRGRPPPAMHGPEAATPRVTRYSATASQPERRCPVLCPV
jgi:hypothetical protein